ncbi:MAG: TRAP transporter small permease subunit [Cocleimonas sp.]|nr:TRAP transporter small permease subunit [Cocleimonas sp.]
MNSAVISNTSPNSGLDSSPSRSKSFIRIIGKVLVATVLLYLANRYLIFWQDWPNLGESIKALMGSNEAEQDSTKIYKGIALLMAYFAVFVFIIIRVSKTPNTTLTADSDTYRKLAFYIIRAAFWAVFLVGVADTVISLLRVENFLEPLVGTNISDAMGLATKRGLYVHYPLIALSFVIAYFSKSLGFTWLAFLVVLSEFFIVLTRFIFSYEQAYMGDLVRFWYAALFLFASAYTLYDNGHVRVDVLYARFKPRKKAWVNALGTLLLGLPLCWTILHYGIGTKYSSLISPIITFEISQSGYGLYVKYLMAGFLIVFAVTMAIQFVSLFLSSCAYLFNEKDAPLPAGGEH